MAKTKHIALFQFKEGTSEEQLNQLFDAILELSETVPGIEDYVAGINNSPEGRSRNFTHGFVMTFQDAAARDAYLGHPEHARVKELIHAIAADGVVFDFEV
jgi:hypothetical protein